MDWSWGSPLGPTLMANTFLVFHIRSWLECCPPEYRSLYHRRHFDDIFVLLNSPEHLKRFHSYLNSCHLNIPCTIGNEKGNRISFLDVNMICEQERFTTSVYRKSTFSGVFTHFDSVLPSSYKLACCINFYADVSRFVQTGLSFT